MDAAALRRLVPADRIKELEQRIAELQALGDGKVSPDRLREARVNALRRKLKQEPKR